MLDRRTTCTTRRDQPAWAIGAHRFVLSPTAALGRVARGVAPLLRLTYHGKLFAEKATKCTGGETRSLPQPPDRYRSPSSLKHCHQHAGMKVVVVFPRDTYCFVFCDAGRSYDDVELTRWTIVRFSQDRRHDVFAHDLCRAFHVVQRRDSMLQGVFRDGSPESTGMETNSLYRSWSPATFMGHPIDQVAGDSSTNVAFQRSTPTCWTITRDCSPRVGQYASK